MAFSIAFRFVSMIRTSPLFKSTSFRFRCPPFVWPQAAGISHPKVCTEQMRTEWVAWILVTVDFMEQHCQLIIPKQIRNEYSASGSKPVWEDICRFPYGFLIFPQRPDKKLPSRGWSAVISPVLASASSAQWPG